MTPYVATDLTVDTVTLQWTYYRTDFNFTGWKYNPPKKKDKPDSFYKKVNDVALIYIPHWSMLMASFSASKLANECNAIPYTNNQYDLVREKVEQAIKSELEHRLYIEKSYISRFDVNKNIEFPSIEEAKEFIKWAQKHPVIGKYIKTPYGDNGDYRKMKSGLVLKIYLKNEDPALPEEIRRNLPPTVRIEAECRKHFRKKMLGKKVSGEILKYPAIWKQFYDSTLEKFKLGGTILNFKDYKSTVQTILQFEYPNNRSSTITKKVHTLIKTSLGQNIKNRKEQVELINKVSNYNILPYAFAKAELIPNNTLLSHSVISVEEQNLREYNDFVLEKNLQIFRQCLNRRKETKLCTVFHTQYTVIAYPTTIPIGKYYYIVPIDDSS